MVHLWFNFIAFIMQFLNLTAKLVRSQHNLNASLPKFFIIGIPKSSTSSLYVLLTSHPDICRSRIKEPHYFDSPYPKRTLPATLHYQSADWYGDISRYHTLLGPPCHAISYLDATTHYFTTPKVPSRIKETYSQEEFQKLKIILILRNPAAREFSWYQHNFRNCQSLMRRYMFVLPENTLGSMHEGPLCSDFHCDILKCQDAVAKTNFVNAGQHLATFKEYYSYGFINLNISKYIDHIHHWLQFFRRDQLFIVNFEYLLANTVAVMDSISSFLNLKPGWWDSNTVLPRLNEAGVKNIHDCATKDALQQYFAPYNAQLYAFMRDPRYVKHPSEPPFPAFKEAKPCE